MHAYCLFCETQKCKTISSLIERIQGIRCISPEVVQRKWTKGICEEVHHQWLPGYIFLYSDEPFTGPIHMSGIIRMLGDGELQGSDLAFANMLHSHNGVIGAIQLHETGQHCTVEHPLWQQMDGKVIKIDRGRRRCCVEFSFDHTRRTVWLGYELVNPVMKNKQKTTAYADRTGGSI